MFMNLLIVSYIMLFNIALDQKNIFLKYFDSGHKSAVITKDDFGNCKAKAFNSIGIVIFEKSYKCNCTNTDLIFEFYDNKSLKKVIFTEVKRDGNIIQEEEIKFDKKGLKIESNIMRRFVNEHDIELESGSESIKQQRVILTPKK